jgi:NADH-quinone oxidoreductase subunit G
MEFPRRVFDGEGVKADVDFGPTLMLNRNRCILCTRCVRFMREVDTDAQINIVDRGYGSQIATFREQGVHSLLSGNLMDVCPVGAITTRDYRFKARPWDNPEAVDTICTFCEKGCNTTVWLKAKPEWAKGARMARVTPRFNPEVNGYWMCDIGRLDYHWVEGDERLERPLVKKANGLLEPVTWSEALSTIADMVLTTGGPSSLRFLVSAHAALEELAVLGRIGGAFNLPEEAVAVGWRVRTKPQPPNVKFKIPPVDAPNVRGARDLGFPVVADANGEANLSAFRQDVEAGRVKALYVFDPGPNGSLGDVSWLIAAKQAGKLPLLIVHGVLLSDLAKVADVVLPGAAWVEKDASYVNMDGRLQAGSRAMAPPGEAQENWKVLSDVGLALGAAVTYSSSADIRAELASALSGNPTYATVATIRFTKPVAARTWLQASNPSERWKWDFMFQDLPPVKFEGRHGLSSLLAAIPLKEVK